MIEKKKIYVIGHKNPDTDSICAAIGYAYLKNRLEPEKGFIAVKAGPINEETKFVLEHFGAQEPSLLRDAANKKMILLDHNEKAQTANGTENAEIIEIVDHHETSDLGKEKADIFYQEIIGSTSTIIADKIFKSGVKMPKQIAGLLLSAILSDTVVFRSVTTTQKDKDIAAKLAEIAGINDLEEYGTKLKKAKADLSKKSVDEIIHGDFKDYDFSGNKAGIGQVEVVDLGEARARKKEIIEKMKEILEKENYNLFIFMLTDILNKGTDLLVVGENTDKVVQDVFNGKLEENSVYVEGMMSRKRQVAQPLREYFAK